MNKILNGTPNLGLKYPPGWGRIFYSKLYRDNLTVIDESINANEESASAIAKEARNEQES